MHKIRNFYGIAASKFREVSFARNGVSNTENGLNWVLCLSKWLEADETSVTWSNLSNLGTTSTSTPTS